MKGSTDSCGGWFDERTTSDRTFDCHLPTLMGLKKGVVNYLCVVCVRTLWNLSRVSEVQSRGTDLRGWIDPVCSSKVRLR